jgi:hypothetical protein
MTSSAGLPHGQNEEKKRFTAENLRRLQPPFHLAEEMGEGVG